MVERIAAVVTSGAEQQRPAQKADFLFPDDLRFPMTRRFSANLGILPARFDQPGGPATGLGRYPQLVMVNTGMDPMPPEESPEEVAQNLKKQITDKKDKAGVITLLDGLTNDKRQETVKAYGGKDKDVDLGIRTMSGDLVKSYGEDGHGIMLLHAGKGLKTGKGFSYQAWQANEWLTDKAPLTPGRWSAVKDLLKPMGVQTAEDARTKNEEGPFADFWTQYGKLPGNGGSLSVLLKERGVFEGKPPEQPVVQAEVKQPAPVAVQPTPPVVIPPDVKVPAAVVPPAPVTVAPDLKAPPVAVPPVAAQPVPDQPKPVPADTTKLATELTTNLPTYSRDQTVALLDRMKTPEEKRAFIETFGKQNPSENQNGYTILWRHLEKRYGEGAHDIWLNHTIPSVEYQTTELKNYMDLKRPTWNHGEFVAVHRYMQGLQGDKERDTAVRAGFEKQAGTGLDVALATQDARCLWSVIDDKDADVRYHGSKQLLDIMTPDQRMKMMDVIGGTNKAETPRTVFWRELRDKLGNDAPDIWLNHVAKGLKTPDGYNYQAYEASTILKSEGRVKPPYKTAMRHLLAGMDVKSPEDANKKSEEGPFAAFWTDYAKIPGNPGNLTAVIGRDGKKIFEDEPEPKPVLAPPPPPPKPFVDKTLLFNSKLCIQGCHDNGRPKSTDFKLSLTGFDPKSDYSALLGRKGLDAPPGAPMTPEERKKLLDWISARKDGKPSGNAPVKDDRKP